LDNSQIISLWSLDGISTGNLCQINACGQLGYDKNRDNKKLNTLKTNTL